MDALNGMPILDVAAVATPSGKLDKHTAVKRWKWGAEERLPGFSGAGRYEGAGYVYCTLAGTDQW